MANDKIEVAVYYFPNWHLHRREQGDDTVFGEWKGLQQAKPRFAGHQQPKVPAWGYQDEADPGVMAQKIDAAADHGVGVFLFDWYYNANGTFLEKALNEGYLKAPNNDRAKFALMWANHKLGNNPGGIGRDVFDPMVEHVAGDYFRHPSYWKVDGKCYFSIYEIKTYIEGMGGLPQAADALALLDRKAKAAGAAGVHLNLIDWQIRNPQEGAEIAAALGADSVTTYVWAHLVKLDDFPQTDFDKVCGRYFSIWDRNRQAYGVPYYPHVTVGWDPTPRVPADQEHDGRGYPNTAVISDNTPARFQAALEQAKARAACLPAAQRVVTVYAWNEWTEGGYLEPDAASGTAYLEAIRNVLGGK